jgi:hypothetical protein
MHDFGALPLKGFDDFWVVVPYVGAPDAGLEVEISFSCIIPKDAVQCFYDSQVEQRVTGQQMVL